MMKTKAAVLIVDNEKLIRDVLARSVSRTGCAVDQSNSGQEALQKLAMSSFDIVISDVKMPGMDGIEFLKKVKSQYPKISVIVITAYSGAYTPADALKDGADKYITKPFKSYEVAEAIQAVVSVRKRRHPARAVAGK